MNPTTISRIGFVLKILVAVFCLYIIFLHLQNHNPGKALVVGLGICVMFAADIVKAVSKTKKEAL